MTGPEDRCTRCGGIGHEMVEFDEERPMQPGFCAVCEGTGVRWAGELKGMLLKLTAATTVVEEMTLIRDIVRFAFNPRRRFVRAG